MDFVERVRKMLMLLDEGREDEFADEVAKLALEAIEDPSICVKAYLFGLAALVDDFMDIGKMDRIHHWHVGFMLLLLSSLCSRRLIRSPQASSSSPRSSRRGASPSEAP